MRFRRRRTGGASYFLPFPRPSVTAARGLLARLLELAPSLKAGSTSPLSLTTLAEEALAIDPASADWQAVSKGLLQLREAGGTELERSATLNQVVARVAAISRPGDPDHAAPVIGIRP